MTDNGFTLRWAIETVLKTFRDDEAAGYRSKSRQYAITILGKAIEQNPIIIDYKLYRCSKYSSRLGGYIVYRNVTGQEPFEPSQDYLDNHKTAVFVTENEAKHYCQIRNELTAVNGSDAVGNDA